MRSVPHLSQPAISELLHVSNKSTIEHDPRLSDAELEPSTSKHLNGVEKIGASTAKKVQRSPMSDEDIARMDEEAANVKSAMWVYLLLIMTISMCSPKFCSRDSVASIASTNPGDGTKRLHGDTSIIHDGSEIEGVHPDAIRGRQTKIDATKECGDAEGYDGMAYLEDTEARG